MLLKNNAGWHFLLLAVLLRLTNGSGFEGDACTMKSIAGVCKLASECPELETAVRSGKFSTRDIVNCGYTTREEIICCPGGGKVVTDNRQTLITTTTTTTPTTSTSTTTTAVTSTDFWSHLLSTTPSPVTYETTPKPDFWLHLLNTTTTTTTPAPLVVNGREINGDTGFIDLSELLSQNGRRQQSSEIVKDNSMAAAENEAAVLRPVPASINDRGFGWRAPPNGMPNAQPPRQWRTGMPFIDERHHSRGGRVVWGAAQPGLAFPNQRNFAWPNQQEMENGNWHMQRPRTFPNAGFQDPFSRQNSWPSIHEVDHFNRPPLNEWPKGNDINANNENLVENFGPINNGAHSQNINESPLPNPFIPTNDLPDRPISKGFQNIAPNPITVINDNLIKSGFEIIKAETHDVENLKLNLAAATADVATTPRSTVTDSFAPFQFQAPPTDYVDEAKNSHRNSQQRSEDFRFPGATENRPVWERNESKKDNTDDVDADVTNTTTIATRINERPAVIACREIDAGLDPGLSYHILGGTPVDLQEFPHMAAIGYRSIGNEQGPYDYRCGGTLIAKKFVLTAAHCVNNRDSQPAVVLLGLVDINNEEQRQKAEEIKIKQVHIHNDYSNSRTYNDVALLELEREVTYSEFIYPTCLYTDLADPPANTPVYVSGWGQINTGSRKKSNILLKAKLNVVPVSRCNASYVEMGLNRRINEGVTNSQMCAHDPGFTRDACQGDSGGPLITVVDETYRKYRVIGIISAGFSCGSSTPGLYARVASYLDYIESVVWPNST